MPIRSDIVHLHSIDLEGPSASWRECRSLLDDEERSRADRFRSGELRRRWTIARAGLRSILARHCGCSPDQIEFSAGPFGKPELAGEAAGTGVTFNLSHSGNMAVVAVGCETEVGVDIEYKKPVREWAGVARRFFSPAENAELLALNEPRRMDAFFDCWTRKEAIIKATGEGLNARLDEFDVSLTPGAASLVIADYSDEQKYIGWRLKVIDLGQRFAGAVATPAHRDYEHCHHDVWEFEHA